MNKLICLLLALMLASSACSQKVTPPGGKVTVAAIDLPQAKYFKDSDGDGYGNDSITTMAAVGRKLPKGFVKDSGDCNDSNASINPAATEICNTIDDDCDGAIDENLHTVYYFDSDHDSYGNVSNKKQSCSGVPVGYVTDSMDCMDGDPLIYPGQIESCNQTDDDCNGKVDDGLKVYTYFWDANGDGYGESVNDKIIICNDTPPGGYATTVVPPAPIWITTTDIPMNMRLHGYVASDLSYENGMKGKDVMAATYFNLLKGLNIQGMNYPDGAMDDWLHLFRPGYGCDKKDFEGTPNKFEEVGQGICTFNGTINFSDDFIKLCDALGVSADWVFNMQSGTLEELKHVVAKYNAGVLYLGHETNNSSNQYWCKDGNAYIQLAQYRLDSAKRWNPDIKCIIDAAPQVPGVVKIWNKPLPKINNYDGVRWYLHAGWAGVNTGDPVRDLQSLHDDLTDVQTPLLKVSYETFNHKLAYVAQTYEPHMDGFPIEYQNQMIGALIVSKYTVFAVNHQLGDNLIECMNLMSLKYLIDGKGKPKAEYWAEALAGKLFMPGSMVCSFSTSIPGVDGCASVKDGHYVVFVRNETASAVAVPGILINGMYKKPTTVTAIHSTAFKGQPAVYETLTESVIQPYSVSTFEVQISN